MEPITIIASIVVAIMVLTIFFKLVGAVERKSGVAPSSVEFKGVIDKKTPVTVHLMNGETFEGVRIGGFVQSDSMKGAFPYELDGMLILEHDDGRKTLIKAKSVRMIEVAAPS